MLDKICFLFKSLYFWYYPCNIVLFTISFNYLLSFTNLIIIKQWLKITIKLKINKKEIKENLTNNKIINYRHHIFLY